MLKRRGLKEVAGVCGVCGQSHNGCAKASGKHTISCKLCALKTINCLFLSHDWSWRVFHISCFYHVPSSHGVDATEVCHLFHSWLHFYCGFLLCTQRTKGSASSYDLQREIAVHGWLLGEHGRHNLCLHGSPQLPSVGVFLCDSGPCITVLCDIIFSRWLSRFAVHYFVCDIYIPQVL
jgi:hypothetical protein